MYDLLFNLALILTVGVIFLITDRNKRQFSKIPDGMAILCQPPGQRYVLYALGVLVCVVVLFFSVLFIQDGAPKEARFMWGLCVAAALLTLFVCILGGNLIARDCVYFNGEKIQIEKAFRKSQTFTWNEIGRIDGDFDHTVSLYLLDDTKILTANSGMMNYQAFCHMIKLVCPRAVAEYYRLQDDEEPQKCVLRYGSEYYVLAVMGILVFIVYLALLIPGDAGKLFHDLSQGGPSEWFSLWFAPVCGTAGLIALFVFSNTKIQYSSEKMILKYPLRRKRELYWQNIRRLELVPTTESGEKHWKKLRLYTKDSVYRLDLNVLTHGKDGFMRVLFEMAAQYEIPCTASRK